MCFLAHLVLHSSVVYVLCCSLVLRVFSGSPCVTWRCCVCAVLQLGFTCVFWLTLRYFSHYCRVHRKPSQTADIGLQVIETGRRSSGLYCEFHCVVLLWLSVVKLSFEQELMTAVASLKLQYFVHRVRGSASQLARTVLEGRQYKRKPKRQWLDVVNQRSGK